MQDVMLSLNKEVRSFLVIKGDEKVTNKAIKAYLQYDWVMNGATIWGIITITFIDLKFLYSHSKNIRLKVHFSHVLNI